MATNTTEYVLRQGGEIIRRNITESALVVNDAMLEQLCNTTVNKFRNLFEVQIKGLPCPVSVITQGKACYLGFPINSLTLRAPWRLIDDKMVPMFGSNTDSVMSMEWTPPEQCNLRVLLLMFPETIGPWRWYVQTVYLYAFSASGEAFRLPLPNLYDDCRVCVGNTARSWSPSAIKALEVTMENFQNSIWNSDLWTTVTESQSMFRYAMNKETQSFEQLPPSNSNWTALCRKVSTSLIEMVRQ